jgi:lipoprotein-releasing system permease protein
MIPISARIGFRYSHTKNSNSFVAFINFFSVLGLSLGILALIVVLSVMNGLEQQLKDRVLGVVPHIVLAATTPQSTLDKITQHKGVRASSPFVTTQALIQTPGELKGVVIQGIVTNDGNSHFSLLTQLNSLQPGKYNIVLGLALARKLNVEVGDSIRLLIPTVSRFTPLGQVPVQRRVTVSGVFSLQSSADTDMAFMALADVQRLSKQRIPETRIFLHDAFAFNQVLTDSLSDSEMDFVSSTWRTQQGPLFDAVKMEKNMMALMLLLVIAVAAFNVISALVMVVTEKQSDIAILQTQGFTQSQIVQVFVFNGMFNSLKGTLFGTFLGMTAVYCLNPLLVFFQVPIALAVTGDPIPVLIKPLQILGIVSLAMLLCLIATIPSALKALKVTPATHLKYD